MTKTCRGCQVEKPLGEFYRHPKMADGHLNHCKDCKRGNAKQHRAVNGDVVRANDRARHQRHRPQRLARMADYRKVNAARVAAQKQAWAATNRARSNAIKAAWKKAQGPAYNRECVNRRRARVAAATIVPFTVEQLTDRMAMFAGCWICGAAEWSEVDHVKPLAAGGAHCLANLRPACSTCNNAKNGRWHGVTWVVGLRTTSPGRPLAAIA